MAMGTISLSAYLIYFFFYNSGFQICSPSSRHPELVRCGGFKDPVCAVYYGTDCNDPSGFCKKTVNSRCMTCFDNSVIGYIPGKCDDLDFTRCKDQSNVRCNPTTEDPVCAFLTEEGCESHLFPKTVINSCVACSDDGVFFYIQGECPKDPVSICRPEDRDPSSCPEEIIPHCTYFRDGNKVWRKTIPSKCNACMESKAVFWVPGECGENANNCPDRIACRNNHFFLKTRY